MNKKSQELAAPNNVTRRGLIAAILNASVKEIATGVVEEKAKQESATRPVSSGAAKPSKTADAG